MLGSPSLDTSDTFNTVRSSCRGRGPLVYDRSTDIIPSAVYNRLTSHGNDRILGVERSGNFRVEVYKEESTLRKGHDVNKVEAHGECALVASDLERGDRFDLHPKNTDHAESESAKSGQSAPPSSVRPFRIQRPAPFSNTHFPVCLVSNSIWTRNVEAVIPAWTERRYRYSGPR